jgi:hypothetical protein
MILRPKDRSSCRLTRKRLWTRQVASAPRVVPGERCRNRRPTIPTPRAAPANVPIRLLRRRLPPVTPCTIPSILRPTLPIPSSITTSTGRVCDPMTLSAWSSGPVAIITRRRHLCRHRRDYHHPPYLFRPRRHRNFQTGRLAVGE